jgi:uncharacterized protein
VSRKCPTCRRLFEPSRATEPFRPFCSARCRAADLGTWLDGGYRIATPLAELEDGSDGSDGSEESDGERSSGPDRPQ